MENGLDRPKWLLKSIAPHIQSAGVGIEFFVHTFSPQYIGKLYEVREWLGRIPLTLHGPFIGVEATSAPGTQDYTHLMNSYEIAFQVARALQCGEMVFHSNECFVVPEEKTRLQQNCMQNLTQLIRTARRFDITLLVENLGLPSKGTPLFNQDEYIELFEKYGEIGCLLDLGHLHLAGWDIARIISTLGKRITGYHLHNNDGTVDSHMRLNIGGMDCESFFPLYREFTPAAHLTLEYSDQHGITAADILEDINYLLEHTAI